MRSVETCYQNPKGSFTGDLVEIGVTAETMLVMQEMQIITI